MPIISLRVKCWKNAGLCWNIKGSICTTERNNRYAGMRIVRISNNTNGGALATLWACFVFGWGVNDTSTFLSYAAVILFFLPFLHYFGKICII